MEFDELITSIQFDIKRKEKQKKLHLKFEIELSEVVLNRRMVFQLLR